MQFLVFQHLDVEHPGIFREFLAEDNIAVTTIELDQGEDIPPLEEFDALWVMGGPMDVWQEQEYPWLRAEKSAIRKAVIDLKLPYLGICLGHQLLASALGGEVKMGSESEVGIMPVKLTEAGQSNPFFENMPATLQTLQWHGAEVIRAPAAANILASSERCSIQSMSIAHIALSIQFHVEITASTVSDWNQIDAYRHALEKELGNEAAFELEQSVQRQLNEFNQDARVIYKNWIKTTGLSS